MAEELQGRRLSNTQTILKLLRDFESRNVTFVEDDGSWPIVWERARGETVWDADGKLYLDLTAAFGVAACGHANPRVVRAGREQMGRLLHAMGDVHPHALKAQLARELSRVTFERWTRKPSPARAAAGLKRARGNKPNTTSGGILQARAKTIFCNSGFEAVEAALKTALLATGKPDVIAFEGGYHGLGYGALNATHRSHFRSPFLAQLGRFGHFAPFARQDGGDYPAEQLERSEAAVRKLFKAHEIGAVLVEPVQVRGGINLPHPEFLPMLRHACNEHRALLVLDEIYTGFGRTGRWFACEHFGVTPDVICLGKALTGGFPLSACVGRAAVMDAAWPPSPGEAIHTSTFLGHPVGCAMALAQIAELRARDLVRQSAKRGEFLLRQLAELPRTFKAGEGEQVRLTSRGLGLLAGVELSQQGSPATAVSLRLIKQLLHRGYILLPEGEHANVISFTPPLTISERQLAKAVKVLRQVLAPEA